MDFVCILFIIGVLGLFSTIFFLAKSLRQYRTVFYIIAIILVLVIFIYLICIYLGYGLRDFLSFFDGRESGHFDGRALLEDLINGIFTLFYLLFSSYKETMGDSGNNPSSPIVISSDDESTTTDKEDENITASAPAWSRAPGQGEDKEDENITEDNEPSKVDKGKRKATEAEGYEQEKKRNRIEEPWDPIKAMREEQEEKDREFAMRLAQDYAEEDRRLAMSLAQESEERPALKQESEERPALKQESEENSDSCSSYSVLSSINSGDEGDVLEEKLKLREEIDEAVRKEQNETLRKKPKD